MASLDAIRSSEINLLIDPTFEDPGRHFNFLMDGFCEASTLRGKVTREIFDLNRRQLVSERMSAFDGVINAWPRCITVMAIHNYLRRFLKLALRMQVRD
jgi:hypothetical protein